MLVNEIVEAFDCSWSVGTIFKKGLYPLTLEKYLSENIKLNIGDICDIHGFQYQIIAIGKGQKILLKQLGFNKEINLSKKELDSLFP